jgi:uncharacterized protein YdhG (YjbR/CyaY superfamily)
MAEPKKDHATIDEYLEQFPEDVKAILSSLRATIREVVPEAVETISYQIPTYKLDGRRLVYFAGWKNHVAMYPVPEGPDEFNKRLAPFKGAKSSIRFPIGQPVPYDLVKQIVALRIKELEKEEK